ncbi:MAG: hypothetical protein WBC78_05570 [Candidatus Sulfotelmatobacter sp.]
MSVRNAFVLLLALCALSFLAACGGGGGTITNPVPPPSGGFSNSDLNGTYVFSVSGTDAAGAPYAIVGTFTANGSGGITGGTLDINDADTTVFTTGPIAGTTIRSGGSYGVSVDGRGTAKLPTSTPFGTIQLDFVLEDSSDGLVTEFDNNGTGSGTLDLQSSGTTPSGTYAFSFSGVAVANNSTTSLAAAGNFTLGSGGAISAGLEDLNGGGIPYPSNTLTGKVVLGPSTTPATTLSATGFQANAALTFDVYAIDATHLKFIETDAFATLSGDAYSQTTTTVPTGTLAFTLAGGVSGPIAVGGFIVTDGAGNITTASSEDVNNVGTVSASPLSFSGTYAAAGTGRSTLSLGGGFVGGSLYAAYPSSGGLLLIEIDGSGGMMAGAAYPQSSTTFAASQGYGLNLSGQNGGATTGSAAEVDDIAEFTAASSGATVTGIIDENSAVPMQAFDVPLTGNYQAPDSNGRGLISATAANNSTSTLNGALNLTFYTVDGTTFPFIELDAGQVSTGVFVMQSTPGASAAIAKAHIMFVSHPLIRSHANRTKQK